MSIGFYNGGNDINQNNFINPCNYSIEDNVMTMRFEEGDINLVVGINRYILLSNSSNYIKYDYKSNMLVVTNNKLNFKTPNGVIVDYTPSQIARFDGIIDKIKEFVRNPIIRLEKETEVLVNHIMEFHKEELINTCLESGNYDELNKLNSSK